MENSSYAVLSSGERPAGRSHVTLRLPQRIASEVDSFAKEHALRKTDAYIHFLELGLNAANAAAASSTLDEVNDKLDRIMKHMGCEL